MKREYSKPMIAFESFSLSTNIAGDCEVKVKTFAKNQCGYIVNAGLRSTIVFTSAVAGCHTVEADGDHDGICYHVPSENYNLFNS